MRILARNCAVLSTAFSHMRIATQLASVTKHRFLCRICSSQATNLWWDMSTFEALSFYRRSSIGIHPVEASSLSALLSTKNCYWKVGISTLRGAFLFDKPIALTFRLGEICFGRRFSDSFHFCMRLPASTTKTQWYTALTSRSITISRHSSGNETVYICTRRSVFDSIHKVYKKSYAFL